jgi:PAS domain S-box-containing protein
VKALLIGNDEATLETVHAKLRARGVSVVRRRDTGGGGGPPLGGAVAHEFSIAVIVALGTRGLGAEASVRALRSVPGGDGPVILVVTEESDPGVLEALIETGASDFVLWPRDAELLAPRLASIEQRASDRRRARAAIRDLEERYHGVLDRTPVMLHTTDAEGRLLSVSEAWLGALGYERREVIGRMFLAFLSDESRRHVVDNVLPELFSSGSVTGVVHEFMRKDGVKLPVLLSAVAERDLHGELVGALAISVPGVAAK